MAGRAATTGWEPTVGGTFGYSDTANWVGGTINDINGLWDSSLTLLGSQTVTFDADTELTTGLAFLYDGGFNETLRGIGDRMLTLGGDILVNTVSTTRVITLGAGAGQNLNIDLGGATRTFTVGPSRTLGFVNVISNGGIIANGGTLNFSGANTYGGTTTVSSGTFSLNGAAGSAVNSDFTVKAGGASTSTLVFSSSTNGNPGTTRAKSVTLNGAGAGVGALMSATGNATANSIEKITNALTTNGFATVTLTPNAARNVRLEAGSFVRNVGSTVLFRGTDLGVSTIDSQTAGDANIRFGGTVGLSGGSGVAGQTTLAIIKGAYGDITAGGTGSGLVTYDATYGVRLLDTTTEYVAAIANNQTALENVRYARTSGSISQDLNLTAATTTINSLSFRISGAGTNSGVTINGDAGTTLKLSSGVIFASQAVTTAAASDAMMISVPTLDLNGQEGVFIALTNGVSNGNTAAPLQINSSIANDGGNGVTIGGTGEIIFGGSTAHTYTGVTTLNSGILRLNKSVANIGIPGDLVMNGGTLLKNINAIPDTASVTMNGGTFWFDSTTSSGNNNHAETINNFTLNGGTLGHHGVNASFVINGTATLNGSDLSMNQAGDLTVGGATNLNGGRLLAREANSTTVFNALTTLNAVNITNPASGAYTAIMLNSHATNKGALLTLNGNVTFTGNATNTNPVLIDSSDLALANQGVIALNGARTFNIGDGAAATDLAVVPALIDGVSAGALTKSGLGTLAVNGANTYTGVTNVDAGTLMIGGSLSGTASVSVAVNATLATDAAASISTAAGGNLSISGTLAPGGVGTTGTLTANLGTDGKFSFASGSTFHLDLQIQPANSDLLSFAATGDWLAGSGLATLALSGSIDYAATYTVFQNVSTTGFTFADIIGYDHENYTAAFVQAGSDYQLTFVSVPEPGATGMLMGGFAVLLGWRRMRGRHARRGV